MTNAVSKTTIESLATEEIWKLIADLKRALLGSKLTPEERDTAYNLLTIANDIRLARPV